MPNPSSLGLDGSLPDAHILQNLSQSLSLQIGNCLIVPYCAISIRMMYRFVSSDIESDRRDWQFHFFNRDAVHLGCDGAFVAPFDQFFNRLVGAGGKHLDPAVREVSGKAGNAEFSGLFLGIGSIIDALHSA